MKKLLFVIFTLFLVTFLPTTSAVSTPCVPQSPNPRAEGLISTPTISDNFSNSTGICVVDSTKAPLAPFKIPTYDDLKSIYYDQVTDPAKKKTGDIGNVLNSDSILDNNKVHFAANQLDINTPLTYSKTAVIFVNSWLSINQNVITSGVNPNAGIVFVVQGDVNVSSTVTQVDAVIISQGQICTAGSGACATTTTSQLLINGSLVSLGNDSTKNIKLNRNLTDNSQPAEKIVWQPKYLVILRDVFSETYQKWSEIP